MHNIEQPENQSAQDQVDTLMVRSRLNEAIASLMRVRDYFRTNRPTKTRDTAIAACDRSIKSLQDEIDIINHSIKEWPKC